MAFILFLSLIVTVVLAELPPIDDSSCPVKPMPPLCPKNEERRCRNHCPPETCVTLYAAFLCIQNQTCVDGCYCKNGFLRVGQKGPCVPRDQCNPLECVNDPNAQRGCDDKCGKTCSDYNVIKKICPKAPCKKDGCDCKDGYVYDPNLNLCVKPNNCTKPCKAHERYSTCLLSECVPNTCDDVGNAVACPAIAADPCPGGCICDYGYVKDKDGNCVDAKTCPSCGGDPNAQAGCGNPCGKTCASLNANKSDLVCPQYCDSNGCDCKEGYLLNTDVKPPRCVLVKNCPKPTNQCGKNEEFYCGPSCPDSEASCANSNPPVCVNKKCQLKCFCKKGFVKDANNTCVPADKCPKQCTKPHESYTNCLLGECVAKTCDELGMPLPCPDIAPPCAGGCICESGYVQDQDGNCIDAKTCRTRFDIAVEVIFTERCVLDIHSYGLHVNMSMLDIQEWKWEEGTFYEDFRLTYVDYRGPTYATLFGFEPVDQAMWVPNYDIWTTQSPNISLSTTTSRYTQTANDVKELPPYEYKPTTGKPATTSKSKKPFKKKTPKPTYWQTFTADKILTWDFWGHAFSAIGNWFASWGR